MSRQICQEINYTSKKQAICTIDRTWEYIVVPELHSHPDLGVYRSYGIHAFERYHDQVRAISCVHDITSIPKEAEQLAEHLNRLQVSPIHLIDIIQDYLAR